MTCPFCRHKHTVPSGDRAFYCPRCKATFENDDEGIDPTCSPGDPSRRMVREEERRERANENKLKHHVRRRYRR